MYIFTCSILDFMSSWVFQCNLMLVQSQYSWFMCVCVCVCVRVLFAGARNWKNQKLWKQEKEWSQETGYNDCKYWTSFLFAITCAVTLSHANKKLINFVASFYRPATNELLLQFCVDRNYSIITMSHCGCRLDFCNARMFDDYWVLS